MKNGLQIWNEKRILYIPKGILMRKEKSEAEKIQEAKECCENFKKDPAGTLFLSVIYIVAIAVFIRPVLNRIYIDFSLIKTLEASFSNFIVIFSVILLFKQCLKFFRGTEDEPDKGNLRTIGVILVCAGILAALISGFTTDKYGWIEHQAMTDLNEKFLKKGSIKCTEVDIDRHNGNTYYGIAKLSDGTTKPTVVYYMLLKTTRYSAEYKIVAKIWWGKSFSFFF